ncbi:MAG: class I SAM-dependent methyltransferase [Chloroflexi bacterium]|nr:MAG: class I SAM-dependent methyltransferase [Chloroflexota bacterium]
MFETVKKINQRPEPFSVYTADELWTDSHTAEQMLAYHLDQSTDAASRKLDFIEKSVDWIVAKFNLNSDSKICDFGCGPGLYTSRFAEIGASVTGIDFSENSLRYARETAVNKNLNVTYILQNYLTFKSDQKFDLITMIWCDYCALSPAQRSSLLHKFHGLLEDNGRLVLDVFSLEAFAQREEISTYEHMLQNGFWSGNDYYGFLNTFKYDLEKVVLDKYTLFEATRTREIYNWLQYFSMDVLKAEFEAQGFYIDERYSDIAGTPYEEGALETAVVAHKIA